MFVVLKIVGSKFEFVDTNELSSPERVEFSVVIESSFENNVDGEDFSLENPKFSNAELFTVERVMDEVLDSTNTTKVFEFPKIL